MTIDDVTKAEPVTAILKSKGAALRALALVAAIVGLILPAITGTVMGMAQSNNLLEVSGWFTLAPIAIAVALIMPSVAPHFSRLTHIAATIIVLIVVGYAGYVFVDAMNQISQLTGAATSMVGNSPQMQAYANSYTQSLGVGVTPGMGLFVMAGAALLMLLQSILGRR